MNSCGEIRIMVIYLLLLILTCSQDVAAQKNPENANLPINQTNNRSVVELMNAITNNLMGTYELTEGEYKHGDWADVKKSKPPRALYWSYPTGVCLLAMQRVFDITGDEKILQFIDKNNRISADQFEYLRWQKQEFGTIYKTENFEKLWRLSMLDDCGAMGAAILETNLRHNIQFSHNLNELVEIIGNFVTRIQYRLPDGTLWRPDSPDGLTIWADDLYMGLPFLIRWAEYKKDPTALDDAANQILNYANRLQDDDGVWFHAYYVDKKQHTCCKWGRGNGWVAVAITEVLSVLPKDHPKYNQIFSIYKRQLDGLIKLQSKNGLWNQVLDHPELTWGTETSCSAQFTYAIARGINRGWLDAGIYTPVVRKALASLSDTSRISLKGQLLKVGSSTSIGSDINYYNERPVEQEKEYSHGSGLMLFALTEIHTLLQNEKKTINLEIREGAGKSVK
jgi:unsaturated rhamnogalacturonyl hydrolase